MTAISDYWQTIHDWNAYKRKGPCRVCIPMTDDISSFGLALHYVNACCKGALLTVEEAKRYCRAPDVMWTEGVPPIVGPA